MPICPAPQPVLRAVRRIRATYDLSLSDALAMWRGMSEAARASWLAD